MRLSVALGLRPYDISQNENGWVVRVLGKGKWPVLAVISAGLAAQLPGRDFTGSPHIPHYRAVCIPND
jgi:hypothetical protein